MPATETVEKQAREEANLGKAKIRVALADGQSLVRNGMERILGEAPGIEMVAISGSLDEAIRHLKGHQPDVLVYDPSSEPGSRISPETIAALKEASPGTAVVIVGSDDDVHMVRDALRGGAQGFVAKSENPEALMQAVTRAAENEPYINGRLAVKLTRLEAGEEADGLTGRETEILRLIALGYTNAEIAQQLFLSIRTVESHRANLLEKLRLSSRAELVGYAIEQKLIP